MGNNADRTRPSQSPGWGAVFFEFRVKDLMYSIFKRRANRTNPEPKIFLKLLSYRLLLNQRQSLFNR